MANTVTGALPAMRHRNLTRISIAIFSLLLCLLAPSLHSHGDETPAGQGWIALFNGKDLEGWTPKIRGYALGENFGNTFRVEDGILKVRYDQYDTFDERYGHLFYKTPYSSYRLRIEYRFTGEQCPGGPAWAVKNSGVMLHSQSPETMDKDQKFPVSIEVQFLGGTGTGERPTCNMCSPGTHIVLNGALIKRHCVNSTSKTFHGEEWVVSETEVRGDKFKHFVNGELVMEYEGTQLDDKDPDAKKLLAANGGKIELTSGYIALQSESAPVEFRKVEILPL
jgi:hypothetical protein